MKKYKEDIRLKRNIYIILLMLVIAISIILFVVTLGSTTARHISSFTRGIQLGIFFGLSIQLISFIFSYSRAIKNTDYLEKMYIKYTDERTQWIIEKSYTSALKTVITGLCFALVISGFYNNLVFLTILFITIFLLIVNLLYYYYYKSQY